MHKPKKRNLSPQKSGDCLEYVNDSLPGLVIPVGSRFQADIPEWTGPSNEAYLNGDLDTSRWLGTRIWPLQHQNTQSEGEKIGKGRPDFCMCRSPRSLRCIMSHVSQARLRLQLDLGPAYKSWKIDEMGEEVGKSWTSKQKKKFENLVMANPLSQSKSFLKPAELAFPSKTRKDIVSYYLNVHVPKRIGMMTRVGCKVLDSDEEEIETPSARNSSKRSRPISVDCSPLAKSHYLTGRR